VFNCKCGKLQKWHIIVKNFINHHHYLHRRRSFRYCSKKWASMRRVCLYSGYGSEIECQCLELAWFFIVKCTVASTYCLSRGSSLVVREVVSATRTAFLFGSHKSCYLVKRRFKQSLEPTNNDENVLVRKTSEEEEALPVKTDPRCSLNPSFSARSFKNAELAGTRY